MHDTSRKRVMPILIHGDASFAGLGAALEVRFTVERSYTRHASLSSPPIASSPL